MAEAEPAATNQTLRAQCPPVFSDHAIFQQGIPVPVWGTSLPGAKVTVQFGNQTKTAIAGEGGRFRVVLDPLTAGRLEALDTPPAGRPADQAGRRWCLDIGDTPIDCAFFPCGILSS